MALTTPIHRYAKNPDYEPEVEELRHVLNQEIGELCSRFWAQLEKDDEEKVEVANVRYVIKRNGPKLLVNSPDFETKLGEMEGAHKITFIEFATMYRQALANSADLVGWSPLHWAASKGNTGAVTALLEFGADVNRGTPDGFTPAHGRL